MSVIKQSCSGLDFGHDSFWLIVSYMVGISSASSTPPPTAGRPEVYHTSKPNQTRQSASETNQAE